MSMKTLLLVLIVSLSAAQAADWPQFRGPNGDGVSTAKNVPTVWSAADNIAWKQSIPGAGWSSPVLVGGKLYLTTAVAESEKPISLRALCIDAATGHIDWNNDVLQPTSDAAHEMHSKNSMASPTPIVD